ncbi:hypothetical protein AQUCO_03200069v1 [Aquilegia coerulea]|uniref:Uncharacterized protein n=1 Tax=Aquilegia coerulea TaxID=218851 RepID=A0A2G5D0X8_AQUCA|nr:hypothetical protein AQUCO_03200069v1 [Aquilegia coerulea]
MKMTLSFLFLLLLIFMFNSAINMVLAESAPAAVRDITGRKVRSGVGYYILPVVRGRGGGLTLGSNINGSCPFDVVQEQHEISNGFPLTFTPTNPKRGVIRVCTDLNIKFSAATICVQSTVWKLSNFDESTRQWFVTSGGVEGNPGRETIDNWFKIEKFAEEADDDYKLVFCPTVCNYCKVICRDVGVFIDSKGVRRLALSDKPFKIMLKKV